MNEPYDDDVLLDFPSEERSGPAGAPPPPSDPLVGLPQRLRARWAAAPPLSAIVERWARQFERVPLPRPGATAPVATAFALGVAIGAFSVWAVKTPVEASAAVSAPEVLADPVLLAATAGAEVTPDAALAPRSTSPPAVATSGTERTEIPVDAVPVDAPRVNAPRVNAVPQPALRDRPRTASRAQAAPPALPRDAPVANQRFRGSLTVRSRPAGAAVFINGRRVGTTPVVLANQTAGSRAVRLTLEGYDTWTSAVRVVANEQLVVTADLQSEGAKSNGRD